MFLGTSPAFIALLLVATFIGGVANLVAIVGFMVTVTTGVPDKEQGLATGLATMSQQVGITMGIPIMSAIATATLRSDGAAYLDQHPDRPHCRDRRQRGPLPPDRAARSCVPAQAGRSKRLRGTRGMSRTNYQPVLLVDAVDYDILRTSG